MDGSASGTKRPVSEPGEDRPTKKTRTNAGRLEPVGADLDFQKIKEAAGNRAIKEEASPGLAGALLAEDEWDGELESTGETSSGEEGKDMSGEHSDANLDDGNQSGEGETHERNDSTLKVKERGQGRKEPGSRAMTGRREPRLIWPKNGSELFRPRDRLVKGKRLSEALIGGPLGNKLFGPLSMILPYERLEGIERMTRAKQKVNRLVWIQKPSELSTAMQPLECCGVRKLPPGRSRGAGIPHRGSGPAFDPTCNQAKALVLQEPASGLNANPHTLTF